MTLVCRHLDYIRAKKTFIFPRINAKDTLDSIKQLDPLLFLIICSIAFWGLLKMSSSCPTCRPGPTGPNSSYATDS